MAETRQQRRARERALETLALAGKFMKNQTIQQHWVTFRDTQLKPFIGEADVHGVLERMMENAFYAGATAFFDLTLKGVGPDDESVEAGAARVQRLVEEINTFANRHRGRGTNA